MEDARDLPGGERASCHGGNLGVGGDFSPRYGPNDGKSPDSEGRIWLRRGHAPMIAGPSCLVSQPVFSATSFLAISLIALLFFNEPLMPLKIVGLAVIIAGMVLVVG